MRLSIIAVSLLLSSCATPNTMMVNPTNGQLANCSATGWGWAGAPLAIMSHDSCVESMRTVGWVTAEEYKNNVAVAK